ncbi:MAG: DNA-directed RNA polymerase subunit beta' [Clostridiaceae bacterium]|nr:DNA-directed RNA polymerase subunit beta' [Clostridiaceae bacterium]
MREPRYEERNIESISIGLASPETIISWSSGEVKKPETINYRTLKPEKDGLFCERIFGPTKDFECHCGKYKKIRYRGMICDRCGVEVTYARVRRERMGHIQLEAPVTHIWYYRGIPSRMGLMLDMSPKTLEKIIYFACYVVLDPGDTPLEKKQLLLDREYREAQMEYGRQAFVAEMGAGAIKALLAEIDVNELSRELREQLPTARGQKRARIIKRLEVVEAFRKSGNRPEWMVLDVIPVLPPDLRPMVQLDGGRFATSDLNDLYRRVINRNNRLSKLLSIGAPGIIVRNEKRMLQEAVDALIDNGRRGRAVTGAGNRPLKSLSDLLKGKQGRFRQNLLGKRVDYSGRSVIVVGPELKLHQCGLPKEMAIELFKPFVMRRLVQDGHAANMKTARYMVERASNIVWDLLEEVIADHPVLLNRAPTLHRLGIQAFEPILVEGRAIQLHPLVCTAYNADFDGDQMAVHVPLSAEAQAEARFLMLSSNNLLKPQDGKPVTVPTQDMVMGCYYLTTEREGEIGEGRLFSSFNEATMAYEAGQIGLHAKIGILTEREINGEKRRRVVHDTYGRFIFNQIIPQNLGFVNRDDEEECFNLECSFRVDKKQLGRIIDRCIQVNGLHETAEILDQIKDLSFHASTRSGISIGIFDMVIPDVKESFLSEAEEKINFITRRFRRGLLDEEGRKKQVVEVWRQTTDSVADALSQSLGADNPIHIMADSGARGSIAQIKQLAGMRGNVADTSGEIIEIPIKSNLREGMNVLEFFISSHGTRKTLSDTALKTADSGYLTRRLVDVAQDVIIEKEDCGTNEYIEVTELVAGRSGAARRTVKSLRDRIVGRYAAIDILHPETSAVIVEANNLITPAYSDAIIAAGITKVPIRSVLTCHCRHGVCAHCYGQSLASGETAVKGEAVGIIAAQSIGEPGTQLTMRTFHTGGIASADDITLGLPRVEELFEARKPKGMAIMAEIGGVVTIEEVSTYRREIRITGSNGATKTIAIPFGTPTLVADGDIVESGDLITDGSINPHDIMKIGGVAAVQRYIISEVIKVYKNNGQEINDKHIEIIARQMMRKIRVEDPGDTELLMGSQVDIFDFIDANKTAEQEGGRPATGQRLLLGITKASLATDSFLSAASFQETTRVLTDAAVKGKSDPLYGLKENVIIGNLIPAGTGLPEYRKVTPVPVIRENRELLQREYDFDNTPYAQALERQRRLEEEAADLKAQARELLISRSRDFDDLGIDPTDETIDMAEIVAEVQTHAAGPSPEDLVDAAAQWRESQRDGTGLPGDGMQAPVFSEVLREMSDVGDQAGSLAAYSSTLQRQQAHVKDGLPPAALGTTSQLHFGEPNDAENWVIDDGTGNDD